MTLRKARGLRSKLATIAVPAAMREARPKPVRKPPKVADIERRIEEAWKAAQGDGWRLVPIEKSGPLLVGLWARLHEQIYGVDVAAALSVKDEWVKAVVAARRAAVQIGDVGDAIEFVTWSWKAEEKRERMRRAGQLEGDWRLSWYNLFSRPGTLLDYQALVRRHRRA